MKTIKNILEEFDKKFVFSKIRGISNWKATAFSDCTGVRKFLKQAIKEALESLQRDGADKVIQYPSEWVDGWNAREKQLREDIKNCLK